MFSFTREIVSARGARIIFHLNSKRGVVRCERLSALFEAGQYEELKNLLSNVAFPEAGRTALEAIRPMFMGGNYLPDTKGG